MVKDIERKKAYEKKWREEHKDWIKNYNQTKGKEAIKKYQEKNKIEILKRQRERYKLNLEKEKIRSKKWRENNKERIAGYHKKYNQRPEVKERLNKKGKTYRFRNDIHFKNAERDKTKRIFPLEGKQCEFCNNKAESHHHYTNPYRFSKFWYVCKQCHEKITKEGQDVFLEGQRWK